MLVTSHRESKWKETCVCSPISCVPIEKPGYNSQTAGANHMPSLAPEPEDSVHSITALLVQLSNGNQEAEAQLIKQVYAELRRQAVRHMRAERRNHTLQPTALVNEAYIRLVQSPHVTWQSRAHFFATAAQLMRHILVDHARAHQAGKRGGIQRQVTLDEAVLPSSERNMTL